MKSREYIKQLMNHVFIKLQATREAGQKEYAHNEDNAFGNFDRLSVQMGLDRKQVLWVYLIKHMDGIFSYIKGHRSQREDVRGRLGDVIVYLILLWGMIDDEENVNFHDELVVSGKVFTVKNRQEFVPSGLGISRICKNCGTDIMIHDVVPADPKEVPFGNHFYCRIEAE